MQHLSSLGQLVMPALIACLPPLLLRRCAVTCVPLSQLAFDAWCSAHGLTSHFSNLYDMMIAEYVRTGDLPAVEALLQRLRQAHVRPELDPQTCANLLRAYLQVGSHASPIHAQ